jgi:RpiR family carbohydrate utilization transcriptional regulator
VFFSCDRLEDTSVYTPMSSRLAQLALLDVLYVAYALALGEKASDNLRRSKDALQR